MSTQDRSVYCEDWGEALTSKSVPVLCVVDLHHGEIDVLQSVPQDVSPGQVRRDANLTSSSLMFLITAETLFYHG